MKLMNTAETMETLKYTAMNNPYQSKVSFLYPMKMSENQNFYDMFLG